MSAGKLAAWIGGGVVALSILTTNVIVVVKLLGSQPTPVVPTPEQPLASLIADAGHRATIAAFYRDFAAVLAADQGIVKTTGQFRTAQNNAANLLDSSNQINYPAFRAAVSQRLGAAIGMDDTSLDEPPPESLRTQYATKRAALVAALTAISTDLGG